VVADRRVAEPRSTHPDERRFPTQAARMDRMYRFQRHIYDATRPPILLGRDRLLQGIDVAPGGTVLEVGCGTGRNIRKLALRLPGVTICGLDVSAEMLRTAAARLPASLTGRVAFARAAAGECDPREPFGRAEQFDAVFFSYSLSMMPDRDSALRSALAALAPEGSIHMVDFGGFAGWPGPTRIAALAWLAAWHVRPQPTGATILRSLGLPVTEERIFGSYAVIARLRPRICQGAPPGTRAPCRSRIT
jgi:S-adenosylmethionine-diacylgycerolhomoserine-N-methlytransferase